jgi:hypothetical protein
MITTILQINYSEGLAFTGKDAAAIIALLDKAMPVQQCNRHNKYGWWQADPDADIAPRVEVLSRDVADESSAQIREELKQANKKLEKHREMIEAAEALSGDGGEEAA